jgi:hypothetical protein
MTTATVKNLIVRCDTELRARGPGTDILIVLELPLERKISPPSQNFRMPDWKVFKEELAARLINIPLLTVLDSEDDVQTAVTNLTSTIQDVIPATVPISKPCPHIKRRCKNKLSDLKNVKNNISNTPYRFRAIVDHPLHDQHKITRNQDGDAILKAKQHWAEVLQEAEERELWITNKYILRLCSGGKTRTPSLKVNMPDGTTAVDTSNEGKVECTDEVVVFTRAYPLPCYPSKTYI